MQRSLIVAGGVVAVLVGLGFVCPQVAELRDTGSLLPVQVLLLAFGGALTTAGVGGLFLGAKGTRATG